jgi:hypothetical protein
LDASDVTCRPNEAFPCSNRQGCGGPFCKKVLESYVSILKANGYVVIPRECHVILEANYILPPYAEQLKIGKERLQDMVQRQQEHTFARKLFDEGLAVNTIRQISDPVTGTEEVFTSLISVIKPKP